LKKACVYIDEHHIMQLTANGQSTMIVNGVKYQGKSISVQGNKVYIDGKEADGMQHPEINITIEGDVKSLDMGTGECTVNGNTHSVESGTGNITINGDVHEVETSTGDIKAKVIDTAISETGDITANKI